MSLYTGAGTLQTGGSNPNCFAGAQSVSEGLEQDSALKGRALCDRRSENDGLLIYANFLENVIADIARRKPG